MRAWVTVSTACCGAVTIQMNEWMPVADWLVLPYLLPYLLFRDCSPPPLPCSTTLAAGPSAQELNTIHTTPSAPELVMDEAGPSGSGGGQAGPSGSASQLDPASQLCVICFDGEYQGAELPACEWLSGCMASGWDRVPMGCLAGFRGGVLPAGAALRYG